AVHELGPRPRARLLRVSQRLSRHGLAALDERVVEVLDLTAERRAVVREHDQELVAQVLGQQRRLDERRLRALGAVVAEHDPARHHAVPSAGSAATSGLRRKNALWPTLHQSISTTPSSRKPTPITSGGPSPNHESPDSEFSGLDRSMQDFTKIAASIRPPSVGPTPIREKLLTHRVSRAREEIRPAKPVSPWEKASIRP